jgi:hypothetical protein
LIGAQQPARCRAVATLISPLFFTLALLVIGRCFAVGEDTRSEQRALLLAAACMHAGATPSLIVAGCCHRRRILVEKFWVHFLPPEWMAALKRSLLGGHVAEVVAAQHAAAAAQQHGGAGGGGGSGGGNDLTALMKGMVRAVARSRPTNALLCAFFALLLLLLLVSGRGRSAWLDSLTCHDHHDLICVLCDDCAMLLM